MYAYLSKRISLALGSFLLLTFLSYLLLATYSQNDPFLAELLDSPKTDASLLARIAADKAKYHYDDPIVARYFLWFGNMLKGDFGVLYGANVRGTAVATRYFATFKYTFNFVLPTFILSLILGLSAGITAAYHRGKLLDICINFFIKIFISVPSFVLAPFFVLLAFALNLSTSYDSLAPENSYASYNVYFMPIVLLTILSLSGYANYGRNVTVQVLQSNYVLIAKAKGMKKMEIFWKYVFRNISIPLFYIFLPSLLFLLSGSFLVERFFLIPGSTSLLVQAFPNGEINASMFSIAFFGFLSLIVVIFTDIGATFIDPRIKLSKSAEFTIFKHLMLSLEKRKITNKAKEHKPTQAATSSKQEGQNGK